MRDCPWYEVAATASWLRKRDNVPNPWNPQKPSGMLRIPQNPHLASFYRIDLFHVMHKGVAADFAASSLELCPHLLNLFVLVPSETFQPFCFFLFS